MKNTRTNRFICWEIIGMAESHKNEGYAVDANEAFYKGLAIMDGSGDGKKSIDGADYQALLSLSFSVGSFHEDFKQAEALIAGAEL